MKNKKKIKLFLITILLFFNFFLYSSKYINYLDGSYYIYQWGLNNNGTVAVDYNVLKNNYEVEYFDLDISNRVFNNQIYNLEYFINTNNKSLAYSKYGVDIDFAKAYALYNNIQRKEQVIVAVIDSGIDINHYELKNNIWINYNEIPNNGIDDDNNGYIDDIYGYNFIDDNANVYVSSIDDIHGTHIAGTIVASHNNGGIEGIAYDKLNLVKIMSLKILGEGGRGSVSSLIKAIEYAHNNGAKICNISLGCYTKEILLEEIIKKYQDMLFVVASGNGVNFVGYNIDYKPVYPASYSFSNVITVSTLLFDGRPYISGNYGMSVDVYAPGSYILSTVPNNQFGYLTGSSVACPFVTGVCAMILCVNPNLSPTQIKIIILETVNRSDSLSGFCNSGGSINAYRALQSIL